MSRKLVTGELPIKRHKGGRTAIFELNPEIVTRMEQALRIGTPTLTAAAFQGISYETMRQWVIKGQEHPESIYGEFIVRIKKAIGEWEIRTVSVLEAHAHGRGPTYEMETVRGPDDQIIMGDDGKPLMQVAKDGNGNPIIKTQAIKSDWRPAMEMLQRRMPKHWASHDEQLNIDAVLTFENNEADSKETMTFQERVAAAYKQAQEDV